MGVFGSGSLVPCSTASEQYILVSVEKAAYFSFISALDVVLVLFGCV